MNNYRGEVIAHGANISTNQWSGVIHVIGVIVIDAPPMAPVVEARWVGGDGGESDMWNGPLHAPTERMRFARE